MRTQIELNETLCKLVGTRNVYFNAPSNTKMKFPCVRYRLSGMDIAHANNRPYHISETYELTLIDYDPDSSLVKKIISIPTVSFSSSYTAEGLYHWVFMVTLY